MEKELSELKTEKETLKTKIIQQEEDKKTRNVEEEKLKEENIQLGFKRDALQNSNHEQIRRIEILKKKKEETEKKVEELEKQIENLKVENKNLKKLKTNPPDPEELSRLRKEKTELEEELGQRLKKSESDCKGLQEKLNNYITCGRRKYKDTELIVP